MKRRRPGVSETASPFRRASIWRAAWRIRLLAPLLPATALLVALTACGTSGRSEAPKDRGPAAARVAAGGPNQGEKRQISAALNAAGSACLGRARLAPAGRDRAERAVATLVRFYRKYPRQEFRLPEGGAESAHMLSVLLVARDKLRRCAPEAVAAIDRALPASVRKALP